jgi:hypothetical protein
MLLKMISLPEGQEERAQQIYYSHRAGGDTKDETQ